MRSLHQSIDFQIRMLEPLLVEKSQDEIVAADVQAVNASKVLSLNPEFQKMLDVHNQYRCLHNVPPMEWDEGIAAKAQEWADGGLYQHSSSDFRRYDGMYHGENLAWAYYSGMTGPDGAAMTKKWYDEIEYTENGKTDTISVDGNAVGHYTQIVWKDSVRLGCGKGRAVVNSYEGDYWVCHYGPGGNIMGRFDTQVLSPTRTVAECQDSGNWPAPAPAPATPAPAPPGTNPDCVDGGINDNPVINLNGSPTACSSLAAFCGTSFVKEKCKMTCGC